MQILYIRLQDHTIEQQSCSQGWVFRPQEKHKTNCLQQSMGLHGTVNVAKFQIFPELSNHHSMQSSIWGYIRELGKPFPLTLPVTGTVAKMAMPATIHGTFFVCYGKGLQETTPSEALWSLASSSLIQWVRKAPHTWSPQRSLSSAQVRQLLRFWCDIGYRKTVSNKLLWRSVLQRSSQKACFSSWMPTEAFGLRRLLSNQEGGPNLIFHYP